MKDYRPAIESAFERLGLWIADNPLKTLIGTLLVVALFAVHLPKITLDTSTEGFLFEDDPVLLEYNAFRDAYGRDERVMLAIGPVEVFTPAVMEKIKRIHERVEAEVPYLDDVTSLVNARNTRGEGDTLIVEDLFEHWPSTSAEWEAIKARAQNNVFYKNLLLSEDGKTTAIVIQTLASAQATASTDVLADFEALTAESATGAEPAKPVYLTDAQNSEIIAAVRKIVLEESGPDLPVMVAGSPVVTDMLKSWMVRDMQTFMRLLVLIVAVSLFAMFRRLSGVFYPLIVILLTLLSTVGLMAWVGAPIKIPTQIVPSLLLAVGVGASVHVLAIFYRHLDKTGDKREAIGYALGHSGLAIVMTSLTTIAGVGSFATASVAPVADLGKFAAFGVFISLLLTVILLPALLAITRIKPRELHPERHPLMDRMLMWLAEFSTTYAKPIVALSAIGMGLSIFFVLKLQLSHYPLGWFPKESEIRVTTLTLDEVMKGTANAEVIIDFKETNALYEPETMQKLERAIAESEAFKGEGYFVGKAFGLPTIVKEINRALNENQESAYRVPDNRDLIAQELLLFSNSGSDDLEDVTDSQFSQVRIAHKIPFLDAIKGAPLIDRLESYYAETFNEAKVTVTGLIPLLVRVMKAAVESTAISYVIAGASITLMMIALLGSVRMGLLSMIPNLAPILAGMGLMVILDIPFDMFMMLVGSIIIGLAVDDTIHFMHNFRRYYNQSHDPKEAVRHTFMTTGRAMTVTSIVLSLGFFVYMFATMHNIFNFGLIAGLCILLALLADLVMAPALMVLFVKNKSKKEEI